MAFAAVISLIHTIERKSDMPIIPTNPKIARLAYRELQSIRNTLKRLDHRYCRGIERSNINALDAEIREAVYSLEDLLLQSSYALNIEDHGVENEIRSVLTRLKKLGRSYSKVLQCPLSKEEDADVDFSGGQSTTVELSDQSERIKSQLLEGTCGPKIISLVGMAGIGKTHLALQVYQDQLIIQEFELRAWVSVGQKDQIHNVLADIIAQIRREPIDRYIKKNIVQLKESFQTSLCDRRYLIILDNVWSLEACSTLIRWLPPGGQDRGILLTTRLEEVAQFCSTKIHHMCFLDNEESWNLLRLNVFVGSSPSPQLEKVGRKIVEKCEGLPLLILAVANILDEHEKTEEYWDMVANKKTTTYPDAYEQISKVLSSSYDILPQHLKICFLYMGVFPRRFEIPLRKLVNLWTVEDFLEKHRYYLEDFSVECMEKIVSKSLAIVCNRSSYSTIKSLRLHSAYWHFCVKEASKNKFFHVFKDLTNASMEGHRRLSVHNNVLLGMKAVHDSILTASTARSLLCTGPYHQYPVPICFDLALLDILDALAIRFYDFPKQVLKLLQLRYLGLTHNGELPSSISNLEQLEYLILRQHHNIKRLSDSACLPEEIWDMKGLRHLRIMGSKLPDPSDGKELRNLSTLYVNAESCTDDVFQNIPHLEKLGIKIELQPENVEIASCFRHVGLLPLLTSLKCVVVNPRLRPQADAPRYYYMNFPSRLKKLCLNGLGYDWMRICLISLLPNLEVLKLRCCAFQGPEWKTKDGEFRRLKYLLLEDMDVVQWTTSGKCFPSFQSLIIRHCYRLKKIPPVMRGLPTLKTLEVVDCSPSLVASAFKIQRGNSSLQVDIISSWNLP